MVITILPEFKLVQCEEFYSPRLLLFTTEHMENS